MSAILDQPFHAPADTDLVDRLVSERNYQLRRCEELAAFIHDGYTDATGYFFRANRDRFDRFTSTPEQIFDIEHVRPYIDAVHWQKALDQTDVYECMPQARKDEWRESIEKREAPEFNEENVRSTIGDLLLARGQFIAEKADGVFRRLSRTHVTNAPEGFRKRFIMDYCFGYGSASLSAPGYLDDLRSIIAKYMGRAIPEGRLGSGNVMDYARTHRRGEWIDLDGGALKIRCHLKGTMHIEVHPDIAWRLNQLLHSLYPASIPSQFREPPKRKPKIPPVHDRPLSFECLHVLRMGTKRQGEREWSTYGDHYSKAAWKEAARVLEQIGGVKDGSVWRFDYCPHDVLHEIQASGVVPDQVAHQFYPTPPEIVDEMLAEAAPSAGARVLEPSAGTGAIADRVREYGPCRPDCVEISPLHCKILESKDHEAIEADFLEWADDQDAMLGGYDFVLMNPPYSEGRAMAHLEAARPLLAEGGKIVALLPATYQSRDLPGRWARTFDRFPGTSISVGVYVEDVE